MVSKRNALKASAIPVTTPQTSKPDEKDAKALALWHEQQNKAAQEKASKEAVDAAAKNNIAVVEEQQNYMLAKAIELGEKMGTHDEFNEDMRVAIKAGEDNDYKAIAALKNLEKFLSDDDLMYIPWPGSELSEAKAKHKEGSNLPLVYDKVKASGGRKGTESFYKTFLYSTPLGRDAYSRLDAIVKENTDAKDRPTNARPSENRNADMAKARKAVSQQMSALKNAGKVRYLIEELKRELPHIKVSWVREQIADETPIDENTDLTRVEIEHMGPVVHSTRCLSIYSSKAKKTLMESMKTAQDYSIGEFIKWNVERAKLIAANNKHLSVWVDDLIESGKVPPEDGDKDKKTGTAKDVRDVHNLEEELKNLDGICGYLFGAPEFEQVRWTEFQSGIKATDEAKYNGFKLRAYLNNIFSDATFENEVKELVVKMDKK